MVNPNRAMSPLQPTGTSITSGATATALAQSHSSTQLASQKPLQMGPPATAAAVGGGGSSTSPFGPASSFADNFWGEKINGFDVLCANLKHSLTSVKELEQFLRDCASSEDAYAKVLNKLVAATNKFSANGTFAPVWSCLREVNERFAAAHVSLVHQLHELIKEIQRYIDELSKKIKKIRENEVQTQTVVSQFQEIQLQLQKSKEAYHNLCVEFDKARRQLDATQLASYQQLSQQQVSTTNLVNLVNNASGGLNTAPILTGANGSSLTGGGVATGGQISTSASQSAMGSSVVGPSGLVAGAASNGNNLQGMSAAAAGTQALNSTGLEVSISVPPPPQQQSSGGGATDRLTSLATSITANRVTQLLKLEKKVKLALEDYKSSIDKYNQVRVEYERKLADSCNHFQYAEETHLKQMRAFIDAYSRLVAATQHTKQQIYAEFSARLADHYTVEYLMHTFVENKRTGQERPDVAQFIETASNPLNNPPVQQQQQQQQFHLNNNQHLLDSNEYSLFVNSNSSGVAARTNNSPLPFSQQQQQQFSNNSTGKPDQLDSAALRSTPPVYFSTSNLMSGNQMYSQLTNSVSTTTLNTINQQQQQMQQQQQQQPVTQSSSISPFNGQSSSSSADNSTKPAKNDTKGGGLNIFNVDFLTRKNRERKEKKNAAAAAAAASAETSQTSQANTSKTSKFSRGGKKANKQNANTSNQYENLGTSNAGLNTTTQTGGLNQTNGSLSVSNHSNKDSSSINSEDSNDQTRTTLNMMNDCVPPHHSTQIGSPTSQLFNNKLSSTNIMIQDNGVTTGGVAGGGTARSISSVTTGSISFDLLDPLKPSTNGGGGTTTTTATGDVDSEGYSIRPPTAIDTIGSSSLDLRGSQHNFNASSSSSTRRRNNNNNTNRANKDNDDMNNFYHNSSSTSSDNNNNGGGSDDDSDDDSDAGDSIGPVKVMLKIKPKSEVADDAEKQKNNTDVLREISKSLQLKAPGQVSMSSLGTSTLGRSGKNRAYYYNYGTSAVAAAAAAAAANPPTTTTTTTTTSTSSTPVNDGLVHPAMSRSISAGSVLAPLSSTTVSSNTQSLLDLDFSLGSKPSASSSTATLTKSGPGEMSVTSNLYNIDEDKEVESSFNPATSAYQARKSSLVSATTTSGTQSPGGQASGSSSSSSTTVTAAASNGRFTPACFPGRTTPDFRHTTSLFEQQGTRASIVSPLTINGGSEIIPIAIAFNETIHAYFKMGDHTKFKVKCFGCMKISFPFAILKMLAIELPQLEFRLSQLQIANQDLKINNQLLKRRTTTTSSEQSPADPFESGGGGGGGAATSSDDLSFEFIGPQLVHELKQQHQANKQAAFFNFELLKYEFKYAQSQPPPLVLNAAWSCAEPGEHTFELTLDYVFAFRKNLAQANFMVILPLTVVWADQMCKITLVKSEPSTAMTQENENKLQVLWQVGAISSSSRITAKFQLTAPGGSKPTTNTTQQQITAANYEQFYQPVYAKFHIDNETLSQVKFQILSPNYKLSLLREKVESGKYFCNYDPQQQQSISTTPTSSSTSNAKTIVPSASSADQQQEAAKQQNGDEQPASSTSPTPSSSSSSTSSTNNNNNNSNTANVAKKTPAAGSLSTHIGSTVDVLLNY